MNLPVTRIEHNTRYRHRLNASLHDGGAKPPFHRVYGPKTAQYYADEFCGGEALPTPAGGGGAPLNPIQLNAWICLAAEQSHFLQKNYRKRKVTSPRYQGQYQIYAS